MHFILTDKPTDESQTGNYLLALLIPVLCTVSGKVLDTYIRFNIKFPSFTMTLVPGITATICFFLYDDVKGDVNWYVLVCGWMSSLALCSQPWTDQLRSRKVASLDIAKAKAASRALAYTGWFCKKNVTEMAEKARNG